MSLYHSKFGITGNCLNVPDFPTKIICWEIKESIEKHSRKCEQNPIRQFIQIHGKR